MSAIRTPKGYVSAMAEPDVVLGSNGRIYVNSASVPLAERHGRRVVRVLEITPGEEKYLRERIADAAGDLMANFADAKKKGGSDGT